MGDHFVLLVDRLLTESTLEAAIQRINELHNASSSSVNEDVTTSVSFHRMDINAGFSQGVLVECKICHDEDADSNMEVPCACRGTLKYAHRKCVQRWCTEKGDTICEICHQKFEPDYTAPPPLFYYTGDPINFRGNWEISRRDLHNHFTPSITMDADFLDHDTDDYPLTSSRSLLCCRIVAMIFMLLLVLRHTLPITLYGAAGEYSISLYMVVILRAIGILLPVYIMFKALTIIQKRRNRQYPAVFLPDDSSDEENDLPRFERDQAGSHQIHVP